MMNTESSPISRVANLLSSYVVFPNDFYGTVVATWTVASHCWPLFDAFGYLAITARTKRAGKSLLGVELMQYLVSNGSAQVAPTPAGIFREIEAEHPTMIFDESESMGSEAKNVMHGLMNAGYKKGQVIKRAVGQFGYKSYDVYCPKIFILIGHPSDTLRDRSIVIEMARTIEAPAKQYQSRIAREECNAMRSDISDAVKAEMNTIADAYEKETAEWLISDRDKELWRSLLAVARVMGTEQEYETIRRASVDISTAKTSPKIQVNMDEEKLLEQMEYAHRLKVDLLAIADSCKEKYPVGIKNTELLDELQALTLSPWRSYTGVGLDLNSLAELMKITGVTSGKQVVTCVFRRPKVKTVMRGYTWQQIERLKG